MNRTQTMTWVMSHLIKMSKINKNRTKMRMMKRMRKRAERKRASKMNRRGKRGTIISSIWMRMRRCKLMHHWQLLYKAHNKVESHRWSGRWLSTLLNTRLMKLAVLSLLGPIRSKESLSSNVQMISARWLISPK